MFFILLFYDDCFFLASGSQGNVSGGSQTGDTLGKALASVSMHHLNPIRPSMPCYVKLRQSIYPSPKNPSGTIQKGNSCPPVCNRLVHINKGLLSYCWSFYWLLTCKMTRIDEFSSGYEPAPKAVAAAVKP